MKTKTDAYCTVCQHAVFASVLCCGKLGRNDGLDC